MCAWHINESIDQEHIVWRSKIRFCGIGPPLHNDRNKLWPRDGIDAENEWRKIHMAVKNQLSNRDNLEQPEYVIKTFFEALRVSNVTGLFNRFCRLDHGYFDKTPFKVSYALDAYTQYDQVLAFVHQVILSVNATTRQPQRNFVRHVFGSNHNLAVWRRHIKALVVSSAQMREIRISQFISFHNHKMDLNAVTWLNSFEYRTKFCIFFQVVFALVRFVLELLRRFFYITVSNPYGGKLFYYRYDLWCKLQTQEIESLQSQEVLQPVALCDLNLETSSVSKMKFYLKKGGLRLICTQTKDKVSTTMHYELMAIVCYVLKNMPCYEPFSLNYVHACIKNIRDQALKKNSKWYIVRADIKNCYPSIKQTLQLEVMRRRLYMLFPNGVIVMRKFKYTSSGRLPSHHIFTCRWTLEMDPPDIGGCLDVQLAKVCEVNIDRFIDQLLRPLVVEPVLKQSNSGKKMFKLIKGIRQGTSLSPLLNAIYIHEALDKHVGDLISSDDCIMLCYVDDILFLSTDLAKTERFLHTMLQGFPDFQLKINLDKLACNFSSSCHQDSLLCRKGYFDFYKQRIWTDTLRCTYDYTYHKIGLHYTFTIHPYVDECVILQRLIRPTIPLIHLDYDLNGFDETIKNIHERALLIAHRAATLFLVSFRLSSLVEPDTAESKHRIAIIKKLIKRVMVLFSKTIDKAVSEGSIRNDLNRHQIRLIVATAFYITWNRKKMRHRETELNAIERLRQRLLMRYLVSIRSHTATDDTQSNSFIHIDWDSKLNRLVYEFPKTEFAELVTLPGKRS